MELIVVLFSRLGKTPLTMANDAGFPSIVALLAKEGDGESGIKKPSLHKKSKSKALLDIESINTFQVTFFHVESLAEMSLVRSKNRFRFLNQIGFE